MEFPWFGVCANVAYGPCNVIEHDRVAVAFAAKSVFEDECGDAVFVEKTRVVISFMIGQSAITTAGANDDCRAGRLVCCGPVRCESRIVVRGRAFGKRIVSFPEWELCFGLCLGDEGAQCQQGKDETQESHTGSFEKECRLWRAKMGQGSCLPAGDDWMNLRA